MAARKKSGTTTKRKSVKAVTAKPVKMKKLASVKKKTKAAPKKAAAGKTTKRAPKLALVKKAGPISVGRKAFSKSQFLAEIATQSSVGKKEIRAVLESISKIIAAHLNKSGPELFSWPGLFKIQVIKKPATKARQGTNPFTGEQMLFKAKPASRRVKVRPLKQLKEMAG